ncbi:hypothetical protein D3C81_1955900 [compost metagenome]
MSLQRNAIPLYAGIVLHAATFDRLVEQGALCRQNMPTTGVIQLTVLKRALYTLHIGDTAFPQHPSFPFLKPGTMTQTDDLQPGILQ